MITLQILVPNLPIGNVNVLKFLDSLRTNRKNGFLDRAEETEFRGQVRSQSGDWERGKVRETSGV